MTMDDFTRHTHVLAVDTEGRPVRTFPVRADDPRLEGLDAVGVAELDAEAAGFEVLDVVTGVGRGLSLVVREP